MTSAPVSLAEQIAWAQRDVRKLEVFATGRAAHAYERDLACARTVLATLQQHEDLQAERDDFRAGFETVERQCRDAGRELRKLKVEHERAMAALRAIRLRAQGDGLRTFDKAIFDLMWIDDECRAALGGAANTAGDAVTTEEER